MRAAGNIAAIIAAIATAWRPDARPIRSEWCAANIRFPTTTGASPGLFDLHDHAYLREPLDAVDDPGTTEIIFVGATQIGKTTLLHAITLSQGEVGRAPMMFAGVDAVHVREERRKIYAMADESPVLRDRVPPDRLRNDMWIDLERALIYTAWSGSTQRLSGRACKIVLCTEADRWKRSIHLAFERTKAFPVHTIVAEGTPIGASPTLWPMYEESDRRKFLVPCPRCGARQELRFFVNRAGPHAGRGGVGGMQDDAGKWRTPDAARKAAYYICEAKGCRIEEHEKAAMVRRGVWCPEGCRVNKSGRVTGKPAHPGRRRGYHLNSLYSPKITFGDAAERWLTVRDSEEGRCSFFNDWLALKFEPRGETPRWKDLGTRLSGEHPRGTIPRWAYFLTAGADVQSDCVYWVVRAWGDRTTSALVDFGCIRRNTDAEKGNAPASDLAQLDQLILRRRWPVLGQTPTGYSQLAVRMLGIDRGWRPSDVDRFVRAHPGTRVTAVFGDPQITPGSLYRPTRVERDVDTGRKAADAPIVWGIDTCAYKSEIADRWSADRTQPGVWWLFQNVIGVPGGEDYLRQITAEKREMKPVHGRKTIRWDLISKQLPNHYWDCEVYARALADLITGQNWDAAQWQTAAQAAAASQQQSAASGQEISRDGIAGVIEEFAAR